MIEVEIYLDDELNVAFGFRRIGEPAYVFTQVSVMIDGKPLDEKIADNEFGPKQQGKEPWLVMKSYYATQGIPFLKNLCTSGVDCSKSEIRVLVSVTVQSIEDRTKKYSYNKEYRLDVKSLPLVGNKNAFKIISQFTELNWGIPEKPLM